VKKNKLWLVKHWFYFANKKSKLNNKHTLKGSLIRFKEPYLGGVALFISGLRGVYSPLDKEPFPLSVLSSQVSGGSALAGDWRVNSW
jgi:hypothetical protein